jgi:hypothetical protein
VVVAAERARVAVLAVGSVTTLRASVLDDAIPPPRCVRAERGNSNN